MSYGLLGGIFDVLDPILDDIDPMHNKVQEWTTGSKNRDEQMPYFEAIAPMIVDYFLPGVGSGVRALDRGLQGDWTGAGLSAIGSVAQLGSWGDAASAGGSASSASSATPAVESTGSGLSSTSGQAAGETATAGQIASNADETNALVNASNSNAYSYAPDEYVTGYGDPPQQFTSANFGARNNFGQENDIGLLGMSQSNGGANSQQFMTLPTSQYSSAAGVGGVGQGLESTGAAAIAANNGDRAWHTYFSGLGSKNSGKVAGVLGEQMLKQQAMQEQRANEVKMKAQQAMASTAGEMPSANRSYSVQQASPYAQFQGGFNPRRYGANVRNRGLLG